MTALPLGSRIRSTREAKGLTLRALAAEVGVSPATLSAIERGHTRVGADRLAALGWALDVVPDELLRPGPGAVERDGSQSPAAGGHWRDFDDLAMDRVLQAALRLFVLQGFHATSMREIAAESGLSVAGVYHHYPSKERILVALLDLTMTELSWRMEAARSEGTSPDEAFALMVEALALFHAMRSDLAFIGASEMRAFGPEERPRIAALRDRVQHALDRQAEECVAAGTPADGIRTATRAIATMCTALPSWFRLDGPLRPQEVAIRYAAFALSMLRSDPGRGDDRELRQGP